LGISLLGHDCHEEATKRAGIRDGRARNTREQDRSTDIGIGGAPREAASKDGGQMNEAGRNPATVHDLRCQYVEWHGQEDETVYTGEEAGNDDLKRDARQPDT